jgi:RimJ/RimL family protein N-acetyltransferase
MKDRIATTLLEIRPTAESDLPYLMNWWNDPEVMVVVGYPGGLGITEDGVREWYEAWVERADPARRHFVIVHPPGATPIGEINYRDWDPQKGSARVDLKIGEPGLWGRGLGKDALKAFVAYLFDDFGLESVCLDVHAHNRRALALYRSLGFEETSRSGDGVMHMKLSRARRSRDKGTAS